MSYQRASDLPKHGQTAQEDRLLHAFQSMGVGNARKNMVICFKCFNYFQNPSPKQYPQKCMACGETYTREKGTGQCCMPDVLLHVKDRIAVVEAVGSVHFKRAVRQKDEFKRLLLQEHDISVFIINNDIVDSSEQMNLRLLARGIYEAMMDTPTYRKAKLGEKEIVGIV